MTTRSIYTGYSDTWVKADNKLMCRVKGGGLYIVSIWPQRFSLYRTWLSSLNVRWQGPPWNLEDRSQYWSKGRVYILYTMTDASTIQAFIVHDTRHQSVTKMRESDSSLGQPSRKRNETRRHCSWVQKCIPLELFAPIPCKVNLLWLISRSFHIWISIKMLQFLRSSIGHCLPGNTKYKLPAPKHKTSLISKDSA
jgi:hypothetical protein